jgi:hypothetical protein
MTNSKVTLSPEEWALVSNPDIILTKNAIIDKVYQLLGKVAEQYTHQTSALPAKLTGDWLQVAAKISRGEQYLGLPWVMLDYPRHFAAGDTKAIRSFFWWGHGFSIHLILQGKYREQWIKNADDWLQQGADNWYIDLATDPWQHHFRKETCIPIRKVSAQAVTSHPFIKYSCWFPMQAWNEIPALWENIFQQWIRIPEE